MKTNFKVLGAAITGLVCAAAIIGNANAQAKPPAYLVVEFEVIDPVGWKEYADAARALGSLGRFIVRGAKGVPLAGEAMRFRSRWPAYTRILSAGRGNSGHCIE